MSNMNTEVSTNSHDWDESYIVFSPEPILKSNLTIEEAFFKIAEEFRQNLKAIQ